MLPYQKIRQTLLFIQTFSAIALAGMPPSGRPGRPEPVAPGMPAVMIASPVISVERALDSIPAAAGCGDMFFDLFIQTAQAEQYGEAVLSLIFVHTGSLALISEYTFSEYCPGGQCVGSSVTADSLLRVDISLRGVIGPEAGASGRKRLSRIALRGSNSCITAIGVTDVSLRMAGTGRPVTPVIRSVVTPDNSGDDVCAGEVEFSCSTPEGNPVKGVGYTIAGGGCTMTGTADDYGSKLVCLCPVKEQVISPFKSDDLLNGVTVFDQVLIFRHILATERLGSPYRMLAADVNESKSITMYGVVALGKLILGDSAGLAGVASWRFVPKNVSFDQGTNSFNSDFTKNMVLSVTPGRMEASFYGIKTGDVNGAAGERPAGERRRTSLAFAEFRGVAGSETEVPVFAPELYNLAAWQLALRYDTAKYRLSDVRWPEELPAFQGRDWHEPRRGEVRLVWYSGESAGLRVDRGTPLFYLRFVSLENDSKGRISLSGDMESLAYNAAGAATDIQLDRLPAADVRRNAGKAQAPESWEAAVYPNPVPDHFRLNLTIPRGGYCRIRITDQFGRQRWLLEQYVEAGFRSFNGPDTLPGGVYFVQFVTEWGTRELRLRKF